MRNTVGTKAYAFPVFTTQECRSSPDKMTGICTAHDSYNATFLTLCALKIFKGLPSLLVEVILYTEDVMHHQRTPSPNQLCQCPSLCVFTTGCCCLPLSRNPGASPRALSQTGFPSLQCSSLLLKNPLLSLCTLLYVLIPHSKFLFFIIIPIPYSFGCQVIQK